MSPALISGLFVALGVVLAIQGAISLSLWSRIRALAPKAPRSANPASITVGLPKPATVPTDPAADALPSPPEVPAGPRPGPRHEVARRLEELTNRHRALEARLAKLEAAAELPLVEGRRASRRVDPGEAAIGGPTLIAIPSLGAPASPSTETADELARRFGAVWALADAGLPTEAVARETGYPVGQVELILGLRRRLNASGMGASADG
jgi:hypothetical protein